MLGMNNEVYAAWPQLGVTFVHLGKHSDPLWDLQGGSKSFPDPPEAEQLGFYRMGSGSTNPTMALTECGLGIQTWRVSQSGTWECKPD